MEQLPKLTVLQRAHDLVLSTYAVTRQFPREERLGLALQIRRAVMAIPLNLFEGHTRHHESEFPQFCENAMGALGEVEYQLLLSRDLGYMTPEGCQELDRQLQEVKRLLRSTILRHDQSALLRRAKR